MGINRTTDSSSRSRNLIINLLGDLLLPLVYVSMILSDPIYFKELFTSSMPIRGLFRPAVISGITISNWDGLIFFYFLPLLYGFFLAYRRAEIFDEGSHPYWSTVKVCFVHSLLCASPILLFLKMPDIWNNPAFFHAVGYSLLFFPLMISLGMFLYLFVRKRRLPMETRKSRLHKKHVILILLLLATYIALRIVIIEKSQYPLGNDVYYHTALSLHIKEGFSPFSSPLLENVPNYYPFLGHLVVTALSELTGASVLRVWPYFDLCMQVFMLITIFYLAYYLSENAWVSLLVLLMMLPWDQFWFEHSSRRIALALTPLFWICLVKFTKKKQKKYLIYSGVFLLIMIAGHHLVPIFSFLVGAIYLGAVFWGARIRRAINKLFYRFKKEKPFFIKPSTSFWYYQAIIRNDLTYMAAFSILAMTVMSLLFLGFSTHGPQKMLFFGEIATSLNKPMGVMTLALLPIGFIGLIGARHDDRNRRIMLQAIAVLYLSSFFYVTKVGIIYPAIGLSHFRIAAEISCISFAVCGALLLAYASKSSNGVWRKAVIITVVIIILLSAASIYGKIRVSTWYADVMNRRMERFSSVLDFMKELPPQSVIAVEPDDYINRYIPGVSGRRIYIARYSPGQQVTIISPGLDFFAVGGLEERYELAKRYFEDPSQLEILDRMKVYSRIDYILLPSQNPAIGFLRDSPYFHEVYRDKYYFLYQLSYP